MTTMTLALTLFILTYVLLLVFSKYRAFIALGSALLFILFNILPLNDALGYIDWNVILMIAGTMGIVSLFIDSKMPALLADKIISVTPNVKWAIISLSLFAGIISAFVDNVATVLMIAPVALTIAKKLNISPIKSIIAIAISSNLQGAATLVGDTTSIILGSTANLNFLDFFFLNGKIGIFWVVQAGALVATLVLLIVFRHANQKIEAMDLTKVENYVPTYLLLGMIVLLITASFLPNMPRTINGIICVSLYLIGLVIHIIKTNKTSIIKHTLKEIDYFTILLLAGLFMVIGGISEAGVVDEIGQLFVKISDNKFIIFTLIVWASVLFSAFIDNIPYVTTMLPVTTVIANQTGIDPFLLYFGLLTGATLGGNLTPIGASANITALGILRKDGYEVKAWQFMKISIPFTLAAVTTGYILIWLIWS
jgi:Na+/H+ antiporter NhaD/arsenite permease-like protein